MDRSDLVLVGLTDLASRLSVDRKAPELRPLPHSVQLPHEATATLADFAQTLQGNRDAWGAEYRAAVGSGPLVDRYLEVVEKIVLRFLRSAL